MATKTGLVQIKDLIKEGKLTERRPYEQGFCKNGKGGFITIELFNNRLYFYAKLYEDALPFRNYRITRETTLKELWEDIRISI